MVAVIERAGTSKESWCPRKGQLMRSFSLQNMALYLVYPPMDEPRREQPKRTNLSCIMERKQVLVARQQSTPYQKQKSALEMAFKKFLESTSQRDMYTAVPDDVVDLLICKTALQTFLPLSVMQLICTPSHCSGGLH